MSLPTVEKLDLTEDATAREVLAIQHAAYRIEAELIGFDEIPPLLETLTELVARPLSWVGVRSADGAVVAALAYVRQSGQIDIDRLMVSPDYFGRGLARALIGAIDPDVRITVSTGSANTPARRLYESNGFASVGDEIVESGLSITHFVREARR